MRSAGFSVAVLVVSSACGDGGGGGAGGAAGTSGSPTTVTGQTGTTGAGQGSTVSSTNQSGATSVQASSSATGAGGVWQPPPGTSWQWQLTGNLDTSIDVAMYDVDLYETSDADIATLKAAGRVVICYFSAGSWEPGRTDSDDFPPATLGDALDGWPDERWLDTRSSAVRDLMKARLDLAASRGCDGVEPDNVDGYQNDSGFDLDDATQLDFNRFIAAEAHARGLSVGLKNDIDQLGDLASDFDWALNEECYLYDECDAYASTFIAQGKAVFHAEYVDAGELDAVCAVTQPLQLSTLVKNLDLDAYRLACP